MASLSDILDSFQENLNEALDRSRRLEEDLILLERDLEDRATEFTFLNDDYRTEQELREMGQEQLWDR